MSLHDDIFDWVRRLPPWKQELYLRTAVSPQISEKDVKEVTAVLLGEPASDCTPRKVAREDLPGAHDEQEPMCIHSLSEIESVNLLADGETLAFERHGLNVVYGQNGTGKTGYSRILKHTGRALRRETVLANVTKPGSPPPRATIFVRLGEEIRSVRLNLEASPPAQLARICVSDSIAGEEYLTSDTEVDYTPAALKSLTRLAKGLKAIGDELASRLDAARTQPLDLRPYPEGTAVARALASLSAASSEEAECGEESIRHLATLSDQERKQLDRLRRKRAEIQAMQAPKLRKLAETSAAQGAQLVDDLRRLHLAFGPDGVKRALIRHAALVDARRAASAAAASFAGEPVGGVGSESWRRMWEAARTFAEHQEQKLPPSHEPSACPLCMQELAPEARARLVRFEDFVKAEISVQVRDAEQAILAARDAMPNVQTIRLRNVEALKQLDDPPGKVGPLLGGWLESAESVAAQLGGDDLNALAPVAPPPLEPVEAWIAARKGEAAEHAALENVQERQALEIALAELQAREELRARLADVLAHVDSLREQERLMAAKKKIGTSTLSTTVTALSRQLIAADLQGALNRHLRALSFNGLEVVVKPKTVRGKPMASLRFKTVDDVPLNSVLSHGEQRRLALAMFLAEIEVLGENSAVVLDDPVSSIDQEGRRHIARSLCALARERQVIVFTHELSFVHELRRHAHAALPTRFQHLCRRGQYVGHVREGLPWEGKKAKQRRQDLHDRLGEVRTSYEAEEPERYRKDVTDFCWMLRSSFERAVEELLGETVTRRDDTVHTKNLRNVVWSEEICELVDRGVDECSPWAHDQPLADGSEPPTPDELRAWLDLYCELLDKAKQARDGRDDSAASKVEPLEPTAEIAALASRGMAARV